MYSATQTPTKPAEERECAIDLYGEYGTPAIGPRTVQKLVLYDAPTKNKKRKSLTRNRANTSKCYPIHVRTPTHNERFLRNTPTIVLSEPTLRSNLKNLQDVEIPLKSLVLHTELGGESRPVQKVSSLHCLTRTIPKKPENHS